jgi:caffeoyl-CoA O-methyltransferase
VLQPAKDTLQDRLLSGQANQYDFAFIDADKESYPDYYELCLRLVRRGGIILLDNMLWSGSVADRTKQSPATRTLRELNHRILADSRVDCSLVPVGDGLMLVRKL